MNPRFKLIETPLVLGMMMISCTNFKQEQQEVIKVPTTELTEDSMESAFLVVLDEIDRNLEMIRKKEGIIAFRDTEGKHHVGPDRNRILKNIQMINSLLDDNAQKIAQLESLLNDTRGKNAALSKLRDERNASIDALHREINALKVELNKRQFSSEELNLRIKDLEMEREKLHIQVQDLDKKAYTAYYAVGTWKELKDEGLAEKKGGILGIGSDHVIDPDFNPEYFTPIDTRETTDIVLYSKKAELLSRHPEDAYELIENDGKITFLRIIDAEAFWKTSKHLVVEIRI